MNKYTTRVGFSVGRGPEWGVSAKRRGKKRVIDGLSGVFWGCFRDVFVAEFLCFL
jgi:hypothetical protein